MKRENSDINVVEWANIPKFPPLDENVVLRLMECFTSSVSFDVVMDNYFTSFRLLTLLRVNNIRATRMLNKNSLRKYTVIGNKQLQKKGTCHYKQRTSSKEAV